jgi:hypothetical protein
MVHDPRSPCEERWGVVHLSQVWAKKLRNRGMVQPEPPSPDPHRGIPRLDSSLDSGARPPVALRGKPGGRAPRHPVRDTPGDACRWSPVRRRESRSPGFHHGPSWPITAGREVPLGAVPAATRALLTISSERSRDEQPAPTVIDGARPPVAVRGKWGTVHLPQVWARKLRNRGMVN